MVKGVTDNGTFYSGFNARGYALGGCETTPTFCHPSMVQEDGGGIYFQRDQDGGGIYFERDGGGAYFHRDGVDGQRQGICRRGVEVKVPENP